MCDSSVPDTLITLHVTRRQAHTHTYTQRKQGSVRGHERVRQTSTTRRGVEKKELVDSRRQKWKGEVDLPFCVKDNSLLPCLFSLCPLLFAPFLSSFLTLYQSHLFLYFYFPLLLFYISISLSFLCFISVFPRWCPLLEYEL